MILSSPVASNSVFGSSSEPNSVSGKRREEWLKLLSRRLF
jgi:hypothetical protein